MSWGAGVSAAVHQDRDTTASRLPGTLVRLYRVERRMSTSSRVTRGGSAVRYLEMIEAGV